MNYYILTYWDAYGVYLIMATSNGLDADALYNKLRFLINVKLKMLLI